MVRVIIFQYIADMPHEFEPNVARSAFLQKKALYNSEGTMRVCVQGAMITRNYKLRDMPKGLFN